MKEILSYNLKRFRKRHSLTQEKAAERAKISYKYWQRLEMTSQTDLPRLKALPKLAYALYTSVDKLLQPIPENDKKRKIKTAQIASERP